MNSAGLAERSQEVAKAQHEQVRGREERRPAQGAGIVRDLHAGRGRGGEPCMAWFVE